MSRHIISLIAYLVCLPLYAEDSANSSALLTNHDFTTNSTGKVYQWTDQNGKKHFSDQAPKNAKSLEISDKLENSGSIYNFTKVDKSQFKPLPQHNLSSAKGMRIEFLKSDYDLSQEEQQQIIKRIQILNQQYLALLTPKDYVALPIKLRLFKNIDNFSQHKKTDPRLGFRHGYYDGECVVLGNNIDDMLKVILHEAAHHLSKVYLGHNIPKWLNEGLAMTLGSYHNQINIDNENILNNEIPIKLRAESLDHIQTYLHMSHTNFQQLETQNRRMSLSHYYISWSIVSFLLNSHKGKAALRHSIEQSKNGLSINDALVKNYGGGIEALNSEWRAWISK